MRFHSLVAFALLPAAACGGGSGGGNTSDAAAVDAPPSTGDGGPLPVDASGPVPDAAQASCTPVRGTNVRLEQVGDLDVLFPLLVTAPAGDNRLFVIERGGLIKIVKNDELVAEEFLNVAANRSGDDPVFAAGGERGLLGLAFHPNYRSNGRFFVFFTTTNANVLEEYKVSSNPDVADNGSHKVLLSIPDFADNHNGGMIQFAPDGKLWIGTGDGGNGGDPQENGQKDSSLLGKMLRIDVDNVPQGRAYGIPSDNPHATSADGDPRPEIWGKGLRNPWRWSFDATGGNVYVADVGQDAVEEINVVPINRAGVNYGWDHYEGSQNYDDADGQADPTPPTTGITMPVVERLQNDNNPSTADWVSIIGGGVYRGTCYPDIQGWYFYSDYRARSTNSELWKFRWDGQVRDHARVQVENFPNQPTSISADAFGQLYVTTDDNIFRIVAGP